MTTLIQYKHYKIILVKLYNLLHGKYVVQLHEFVKIFSYLIYFLLQKDQSLPFVLATIFNVYNSHSANIIAVVYIHFLLMKNMFHMDIIHIIFLLFVPYFVTNSFTRF